MYTNSLVNMIHGNSKYPEPKVGMGATLLFWTDRNPCTIIEVSKNGKTIKVREDKYKRTDNRGLSESQDYEYFDNPDGCEYVFTLRKNGSWVKKGDSMKDGLRLAVGRREKYHDFTF